MRPAQSRLHLPPLRFPELLIRMVFHFVDKQALPPAKHSTLLKQLLSALHSKHHASIFSHAT